MMSILQQVLFVLLAALAIYLFVRKVRFIRRNIKLGQQETFEPDPRRWRNLLLMALGQKRMFDKPLVALLHLAVYGGFIIINIEILEIILDGIFGTHRLFAPYLGSFYSFVLNFFEILAFLVLLSCTVFLIRRNLVRVPRLNWKELNGWPRSDANYILVFEILLMALFLTMNAADKALQIQNYGHYAQVSTHFLVSGLITPHFVSLPSSTLVGIERSAWWLHIAGVFFFLNYLPYSKHLHILLAFPNTYFVRLMPQAKMQNMPEIQQEVLYAMQPETAPAASTEAPKRFGAKDVPDLSWKALLDAYTCTECGRCTEACPAHHTGKLLSPRKIMMDTRDRMEDIGRQIDREGSFNGDGKTLLYDYISAEELRACTSCQACVQVCPVLIHPLYIINQLKRYLIMEESNAPQEWNSMFSNVENNFAPWKFAPDERAKWTENI